MAQIRLHHRVIIVMLVAIDLYACACACALKEYFFFSLPFDKKEKTSKSHGKQDDRP